MTRKNLSAQTLPVFPINGASLDSSWVWRTPLPQVKTHFPTREDGERPQWAQTLPPIQENKRLIRRPTLHSAPFPSKRVVARRTRHATRTGNKKPRDLFLLFPVRVCFLRRQRGPPLPLFPTGSNHLMPDCLSRRVHDANVLPSPLSLLYRLHGWKSGRAGAGKCEATRKNLVLHQALWFASEV